MNPPPPVVVARAAMATRFEIALHGGSPVSLRAAAEEALDEVQRVEALLSWRLPTSQVAHLNARAGDEPVRVNPELFVLLKQCRGFTEMTAGAFDITVGPLMRAWGFHKDNAGPPDPVEIQQAREACGMEHVELDEARQTVRFLRPGMRLDFGAIGKGYALDLAVEILRDAGIENALIHGGTSTVFALGHPPDATHWKVAVEYPPSDDVESPLPVLSVVELCDQSMSVSAVWGRVFRVGQDVFGHVIDPRTGGPSRKALLSIWQSDSAAESDALSTALLTEGPAGMTGLNERFPRARTLVLQGVQAARNYEVAAHQLRWNPLAPAANPPLH